MAVLMGALLASVWCATATLTRKMSRPPCCSPRSQYALVTLILLSALTQTAAAAQPVTHPTACLPQLCGSPAPHLQSAQRLAPSQLAASSQQLQQQPFALQSAQRPTPSQLAASSQQLQQQPVASQRSQQLASPRQSFASQQLVLRQQPLASLPDSQHGLLQPRSQLGSQHGLLQLGSLRPRRQLGALRLHSQFGSRLDLLLSYLLRPFCPLQQLGSSRSQLSSQSSRQLGSQQLDSRLVSRQLDSRNLDAQPVSSRIVSRQPDPQLDSPQLDSPHSMLQCPELPLTLLVSAAQASNSQRTSQISFCLLLQLPPKWQLGVYSSILLLRCCLTYLHHSVCGLLHHMLDLRIGSIVLLCAYISRMLPPRLSRGGRPESGPQWPRCMSTLHTAPLVSRPHKCGNTLLLSPVQ